MTAGSAGVPDLASLPWRTGRRKLRTVYAVSGDRPGEDDELIGLMDTAELAAEAEATHNAALARRRGSHGESPA